MTDELRRRLRAADPAAPAGGLSERTRELMEAAMTTTDPAPPTTAHSPARSTPPRRMGVLAAAAAAVIAVAAGAALLLPEDAAPPAAAPDTLELALPDPAMAASCIVYSREFLAPMPVAFSGTATEVGDGTVRLDVDTWYRGGDADVAVLASPTGPMTSIDGVTFTEGQRYLVTASEEGVVNGCGYTAPWTAAMEKDFAAVFAR
jgi:hypothetical protein